MEKTVEFFKEVFKWKIELNDRLGFYDIPEINPRNEAIGGAVFTRKRAKLPFLTVFIQFEDIKEKAKLIH